MAKKDYEVDDWENLDIDYDGFEDDFDGDNASDPDGKSRKPISKIKTTLKQSAEQKFKDSKFRREVLKASLPKEYSAVLEDYDTISKEVGDVYREQQKEWEKQRSGIKKAVKPYSEVIGKLGFKKLQAWAEAEDRVSSGTPSDEEIDELKVQSLMADVFEGMQDKQTQHLTQLETARQEREDDRYAEAVADREATTKRGIEGNTLLSSINNGITTITDYTNKIDFKYKKRSLELQARLLVTNQRALTTLTSFRELAVKELQDIHKNTALPDYLKIKSDEMITKAFKEKMAETFSAPFNGAGAHLQKRVFSKVKDKMRDWWQTIGEVVTGANDANESFTDGAVGGDGTAWGGLKAMAGGAAADWFVNKPANWAKNVITPKLREYLEKNHNLVVSGSNLKTMGSQFGDLFNEALKRGETGNAFFDKIIDLFDLQGAAVTEQNTLWNKKDLDLEKSVFMDNRFKLSVTDVIPAWLKKIYGEVYGINHYGADAVDMSWDFRSEKFVKTEDANRDALDGLVKTDNIKRQRESIDKWIEIVGDGASFSKKTRAFLEKWLLKKLRSSDAINPLLLLSDSLPAPKDVRQELEMVIAASYKLSPKAVETAKGGTMFDIGKAIKEGNNTYANDRLNKTADAAVDAKRQVRVISEDDIIRLSSTPEGRRALIDANIVVDDGNGNMQYNYGIDDRVLAQYETGRYREKKINGRNTKDFIGYRKSRNVTSVDGQYQLTDDRYNEMLDDQDYGDLEVRLRKNAGFGKGFEYLGLTDEQKYEKQVRKSLEGVANPTMLPGYGRDFFFTRDGKLITAGNKYFDRLRAIHAPELHKHFGLGYASGGRIPSFAKGGDTASLKPGVTKGQPGDEQVVKAHGGEFVVAHDAAKFNVQLLAAINKYGAPLINADGSINSVYHKLFGFDKAKNFAKGAGKDLAVGAKNIKDEQGEIVIKNILSRLDFATPRTGLDKLIAEITDTKIPVEKRLPKALKLWGEAQKDSLKSLGAIGYGKRLASQGINIAGGKFDKWLDSDGTGVNVEIKNQLLRGASSFGKGLYGGFTNYAGDLKDKFKNKMINRDATMEAISKTLAETEQPKRFTTALDLYFKGRGTPFITKHGFGRGDYVDQNTGAVIRNPSQITGTIVDREGSIVVSMDDLLGNDIVTRSGKPFRLLGLEEQHRKYHTTTEYVANRYAVISQSQRLKDAIEKGKQFRDKWLRDEPVDCYTRDNLVTPKLRATGFKAGEYIDKNTGNTLWSHHDITGAVIDKNQQELLSEAELLDGLFNSKGEHIKISKLKQARNLVFKRGIETYNRYAAKHVNKFKDKAMNAMSAMGEKRVGLNFDDDPIDVYVKGETSPRITVAMFKSGKMMDVKSGKPIKSHSGIQGPVISAADASGNQLITDEDIKTGLVDALGEDLYLPRMASAGTRFKNYLKEAVLPKGKFNQIRNFISMSPEKRMEEMNKLLEKYGVAFDVYVKGEPLIPRLTKLGFEGSKYISQKTGLALKLPDFIDGPVLDLEGNIILSAEEIERGLETIDGKKVKIGVDFKEGGLINNLMGSASIMSRISGKRQALLKGLGLGPKDPAQEEDKGGHNTLYTIKFRNKKGMPLDPQLARINNRMFTKEDIKRGMLVSIEYGDGTSKTEVIDDVENIDQTTWLKSATSDVITDGVSFSVVFHGGGYIVDDEGKVIKTAFHTGKKKAKVAKSITAGLSPIKGMFGSAFDSILDKLGIKSRLGSWQQQREDKAKGKTDEKGENGKSEKKESWMGKFIKKLTLPLTLLFGGITSGIGAMKATLLAGISWLGQSIVSKSLLGGMGSFIGRSGLGKALAVGALTYGGIKAYNYLDGDASGPSSYGFGDTNAANAGLDTTSKVWNLANAAQAPEGKTSKGFMESLASNPELASALAMGAMMLPGNFKRIGKGILGVGKKAMEWGGTAMGWGGRKLAELGIGTARAGGRVAARVAPAGLRTTGSLISGAWRMTGGMGGLALRAAPLLAGLGGAIFPAVMLAGAFAAGWYAGKGLLKLWNNHKNPWNRFRMAQYGFNHNDEETMQKIAKIESVATDLITINGEGQPSLKTDEKAMIEILKVCGIYDEQGKLIKEQESRVEPFAIWFKERFLRVYASYLKSLKRMRGKAEMIDLTLLNRKEQLALANDTHFKDLTASPYVVLQSPFEDPAETEMDATDVDIIYRKLVNKIKTSKDIKDGEIKNFNKLANADGLDKNIAKPVDKKAPAEDRLKAELDKQLDQQSAKRFDAKSMVDKANAAVKYQADAANILTKTHNAQIRAATEEATKETEKQFEKSSSSLMDKLKSGLSSINNVINASFVGDASRAATSAWNTTGNAIDSAGSWIGDKFDSLTGKNKETQQAVFNAFKKAGLSTNQAKAITAEVGRENDFKASVIYGCHVDPASSKNGQPIVNVGMLSWNGARGTKLIELLRAKGLIDSRGKMKQSQEALDVQAQFAVSEMRGGYAKKLPHFWGQPNAEPESFAAELGKNYVVWAYGQDTIRSGNGRKAFNWKEHDAKRRSYLKGMEGVGGGGATGGTPTAKPTAGTPATTASSKASANTPGYMLTGGSTKSPVAVNPAKGGGGSGGGGGHGSIPAVKAKAKVFFGDSIAEGYKNYHKGDGWTKVGINPKTVLFYLNNTVFKEPSNYRDKDLYLSTGISNNPTDTLSIATQLQRLKDCGIKAKVFGVSNQYPKGNPIGLNAFLLSLCKRFGHTFLGGFNAGKDKIHPANWSTLPGSSAGAPKAAGAKKATSTTGKSIAKATAAPGHMIAGGGNKASSSSAVSPQISNTVNVDGSADWDFDKVAETAIRNNKGESTGYCAKATTVALMAGDLKGKIKRMFGGRLGHAYEFLTNLPKLGFNAVFRGNTLTGFRPLKGDVAVFDRKVYGKDKPNGGGWVYGHACLWTGANWVSDFIQPTIYPRRSYATSGGIPFTIFRANGIASKNVASQAVGRDEDDMVTPSTGPLNSQANQSNQMSSEAQVNNTVNSLNNGTATTSATPYTPPVQNDPTAQMSGSEVTDLLGKQLNVQQEILSVLREIAKVSSSSSSVDKATSPDQSTPGLTKPNLSAIRNQKSMFDDVKNPVSVLKPA